MLYILPFQRDRNSTSKDYQRQGRGNFNCPNLANTALVPPPSSDDMRGQLSPSEYPRPTDDAQQFQQVPPAEENAAGSIPCIRESFKNRGISDDTQAILLSSWRESTKNNIGHISENGCHFVVKGKLMYLKQM